MRERGILFSAPMVQALLAGRKTQTRRAVKKLRVRLRHEVSSDLQGLGLKDIDAAPGVYPAEMNTHGAVSIVRDGDRLGIKPGEFDFVCPFADGHTYLRKHADGRMVWTIIPTESRLWVRETWAKRYADAERDPADGVMYRADGLCVVQPRWKPSIFMPRWASRVSLELTEVRVERLIDISSDDARAEGCEDTAESSVRGNYAKLWNNINGPGSWDLNPWVWAISFRVLQGETGKSA